MDASIFFNREISLLKFNRRVLDLALDINIPLLERLRYLCISSSNLDEFFEVRLASLKKKQDDKEDLLTDDGLDLNTQLELIYKEAQALVKEQYRVLNDVIVPALAEQDINFIRRNHWSEEQKAWIKAYFAANLLPVLSPLNLDPAHPFPKIINKSLNFVVKIEGKDAFGRDSSYAVVQAPRALPRLIHLPENISNSAYDFVFLSSILHAHVHDLFPGMTIKGCYQFRVTRNSDLSIDTEESDDLLHVIKEELQERNYGEAVRLEVADNCPEEDMQFLLTQFNLGQEDLYQVHGPVNMSRLAFVIDEVSKPELKFPPFTPNNPLPAQENIFELLQREKNILVHHPYQSFNPVIEFVRQAAQDPNVLAIKQTLYRTGSQSPLVDALVEAAQAGKEVTVIVELKARFDEEANVKLATRLQNANAHVVYGVVNYKTHAKVTLVVRKESESFKRYVHLGTGNYHAGTARIYTDYGLFTNDATVGEDVHQIFQQLTGLGKAIALQKLLQAPFSLHQGMLDYIDQEISQAKKGNKAYILVKTNALIESKVIKKLYEASQAGVKIDLIIRGICCLRPGVEGLSENIKVRSILGRFLEHTRVFYFYNNGEDMLFCSSADWMSRNFFRRVELCFPIEDKVLKQRVLQDLDLYLQDNCHAWILNTEGNYIRATPEEGQVAMHAQLQLLDKYTKKL